MNMVWHDYQLVIFQSAGHCKVFPKVGEVINHVTMAADCHVNL